MCVLLCVCMFGVCMCSFLGGVFVWLHVCLFLLRSCLMCYSCLCVLLLCACSCVDSLAIVIPCLCVCDVCVFALYVGVFLCLFCWVCVCLCVLMFACVVCAGVVAPSLFWCYVSVPPPCWCVCGGWGYCCVSVCLVVCVVVGVFLPPLCLLGFVLCVCFCF